MSRGFNLNYPATDSIAVNDQIMFNLQLPNENKDKMNGKIFDYTNAYFDNSNNYPPMNSNEIRECFETKRQETNKINLFLSLIVLFIVVIIFFIVLDRR
jgi:hypothetical protein